MPSESSSGVKFEIGHVLFIDIVGYSKLLIDEQKEQLRQLTDIVLGTAQVAESTNEKLVRVPAGDGMALVFRDSPEEPACCALQVAKALRAHPEIAVRMGVHSGPVSEVSDVSGRTNIAGAGINMAQRVMDCGDAGHILLSRHVAEDLEQYPRWRANLHDLGECEVKHGVRIGLANLYDSEVGNAQLPKKLQAVKSHQAHVRWATVAIGLLVLAALATAVLSFLRKGPGRSLATAVEKSIAVLPFDNLSSDKANAYFTEGVQDEILTHLARIADLKVISRTSVMQYKSGAPRNLREIGQQLGVAHVVEGSVQRAANKVRVNAQLLDARTDAHLWAQTYDRDLADVFAIQSEIAKAIADQLQAKLSPSETAAIAARPTQNTEAYDLFLRGKQLVHEHAPRLEDPRFDQSFSEAVNLLEKAVALDPNFALAHCLLVEANLSLYWHAQARPGTRERAQVALDAARRLAPQAGETYLAEALFFYWGQRDYDRALESLEKAARVSPNNADVFRLSARVERRLNRWPEAIRHGLRAVELDPRGWEPRDELISTYTIDRQYGSAELQADRAIAEFPDRADHFRALKMDAALARGDLKTARATIATLSVPDSTWQILTTAYWERNYEETRRLLNLWADRPPNDTTFYPASFLEAMMARAAGDSGKARAAFTAARQHFSELLRDRGDEEPALLSQLAIVDAGLGHKEEALNNARRALELLPPSKDNLGSAVLQKNLALVYCWSGERDRALEELAAAVKMPDVPTYGELTFDPGWDSLRGDPRFEKIVASLAPKGNAASPTK